MNTLENMIIANGKNITADAFSCKFNNITQKYDVKFNSGKVYSYNYESIVWLKNPEILNPLNFRIIYDKKELFDISGIYVFRDGYRKYWHIYFSNGSERDCEDSLLKIAVSCLNNTDSKDVFNYLKTAADLVSVRSEDGTRLLSKQYEKISFVSSDKAFACYVNPKTNPAGKPGTFIPVFPFGCNASQYSAVSNALENQISIIEGPPGTGKTQTILNIIANLLIAGKTMQVVSNNNNAVANVLEKLSSPEYGMGFLAAALGNSNNKTRFIHGQESRYPDIIQEWASCRSGEAVLQEEVYSRSGELSIVFRKQERLAIARQELNSLEVEFKYFTDYSGEKDKVFSDIRMRRKPESGKVLQLLGECEKFSDAGRSLSFFFKIKCRFIYGIAKWDFYRSEIAAVVTLFQLLFYRTRRGELVREIEDLEMSLSDSGGADRVRDFCKISMDYLKGKLYKKYGKKTDRVIFTEEDLWKNPDEVQKEYPVILSSTYSARCSLCKDAEFDYVIIDEASQVDVATGALALSCAKNAVIVGDSRQLPNVITEEKKRQLDKIFGSFNISSSYNFAEKSFLKSVCEVFPKAPKTLLREHYRCHPKIINFCNQKFYGGELLIMTKDRGEKDVISVLKTAEGNHERERMNQRQVDVITQELLPALSCPDDDVGIIAPYNNQVRAIQEALGGREIDIATVHKFQGREKDAIIITTVDDEVTDFSDDPYLLNVAVSRAKRNLYLVVSGNRQPDDSNIADLIDYIEYNNFTVREARVYSVFDFLYSQYRERRIQYLKGQSRVSEYDSENLMYVLIKEVLDEKGFFSLDVVCHQPLRMLLRDLSLLDEEERRYVLNSATHIDFLIYNRIGKKPLLAVEVDGFSFHRRGSVQAGRDRKKDHILETYGIPLVRFSTNGSGEKEKLAAKLKAVVEGRREGDVET